MTAARSLMRRPRLNLIANDPMNDPGIETARLRLRAITQDDLDDLLDIWHDPQAMRLFPKRLDRDEMSAWIDRNQQRYVEYGHGIWAVILKETGAFVGDCGLVWQDVGGAQELEVGYHFKPAFWGHGYAPEAARACIDYAFEQLSHPRVISMIRPENTASRRVAEKNGLRYEKQLEWRGYLHNVFVIEKD